MVKKIQPKSGDRQVLTVEQRDELVTMLRKVEHRGAVLTEVGREIGAQEARYPGEKPPRYEVYARWLFDGLTESDPVRLRAELILCAAVAVARIEQLDRDAARKEA